MAKAIKIRSHKRAGKTVRTHFRQMRQGKQTEGKAGKELSGKKEAQDNAKTLALVDKLANTILSIGRGPGILNSPEYDMNRNVTALSQP